MSRKFISKGELLAAALVLLIVLAAYFLMARASHEPVYARISVRNHPDIYLELSEDMEFILPQNPNVRFKIAGGGVAFTASDCPDQLCVNMGFLHRAGQSAACLPNFVSLVIIGPEGEHDVIVR